MRVPDYLSPTSVNAFFNDRVEFYLKYVADNRPPRIPQTQPMAAGSAFDAFVKNYLMYALTGSVTPEFEIEAIFEAQVEPQNRDWAIIHGEHIFNEYKASGALSDLMLEMSHAKELPRFEFTVKSKVPCGKYMDGIPLLGKPDIFFRTADGTAVIYDWKVNGYCGANATSPKKGYVKCRDSWRGGYAPSRGAGTAHKDCQIMSIGCIGVNISYGLEEVDKQWADQTAIYLWLMGEPVGTRAIVGIDQLCGVPRDSGSMNLRVASHRCRVSRGYQLGLLDRIHTVWDAVQTGVIFDTDNEAKCAQLDQYYLAYERSDDCNPDWEDWFVKVTR